MFQVVCNKDFELIVFSVLYKKRLYFRIIVHNQSTEHPTR